MSTSEVRLWSVKKQNRQDPDQIRPFLLVTIYRLVASEASPLLTIEVDITGRYYQTSSSATKNLSADNDILKKVIKRPGKPTSSTNER